MADSIDDSAAPEGTKTFASRTSNKGKDENQGALAKNVINPLVNFAKTSAVFVANCKRPEDQQFFSVATMTAIGFLAVGGLGFAIKLLHIPINQILMS
jgi:protein transport protein SEC61 subunit gamma and related proteins